ncbi:hypothetical protein ACFPIF_03095 [Brevundimonas faecalis]|uniref:hypothetical protein n=1 Tax=Brevundimonas faecalis TaxID=947378 RepID=UPI003616C3A8
MTRYLDRIIEPDLDSEVPDEEVWDNPGRLTADDCFEQLGRDWRRPFHSGDQETEE